jgi:hypothetical protein
VATKTSGDEDDWDDGDEELEPWKCRKGKTKIALALTFVRNLYIRVGSGWLATIDVSASEPGGVA